MSSLVLHNDNWPNKYFVRWCGKRWFDNYAENRATMMTELGLENTPDKNQIKEKINWCYEHTDGRKWSVSIRSKQNIFDGKDGENIHGEWWCFEDEADAVLFKLLL